MRSVDTTPTSRLADTRRQALSSARLIPIAVFFAIGSLVYAALPFLVSSFWLSILDYAGIAAIAALGLNLLTGNAGQVSLGTPFFMGFGAYTAAFLGMDLSLPMLVWLPAAMLIGGAIGAAVGPFALRLRGQYLVVVTLGLVMLGLHIFQNWTSITGGPAGRNVEVEASLGPVDFAALSLPGGMIFSRDHGYFYLIWALVAYVALMIRNIVAGRPGRALMALRDGEMMAEVIGVKVARYKVGAFALSSALAAAAGALYVAYVRYCSPAEWDLLLGVQYLAMIVIGGIGSVFGSILGALFAAMVPHLIELASPLIPFVAKHPTAPGVLSIFSLNQILYGLLIVIFLIYEPAGLAGLIRRLWARAAQSNKDGEISPRNRGRTDHDQN